MQYRVLFRINGYSYFTELFETLGEAFRFIDNAEATGKVLVIRIEDEEGEVVCS